jgi:hypothetical protein
MVRRRSSSICTLVSSDVLGRLVMVMFAPWLE